MPGSDNVFGSWKLEIKTNKEGFPEGIDEAIFFSDFRIPTSHFHSPHSDFYPVLINHRWNPLGYGNQGS